MGIFLFLFKNKTAILSVILAVVIGSGLLYINYIKSDLRAVVAQRDQYKTLLEVSQANIKSLQADIDTQNEAVEQFKQDAEKRAKANAEEIKKAQASAEKYKKQAAELAKRRPPVNTNVCKASEDLINEEILNGRK